MLPKARIKFVKSLQIKKYRKQEQLFLVQGAKSVMELLKSAFEVVMIVGTDDYLKKINVPKTAEVFEANESELSTLGDFQANESLVAVARMKPNYPINIGEEEFGLVLDDIRDPGNLGTIIRTADWYGITKIIASEETVDFYNSKVITSTMGSFSRVEVYYTDLGSYLDKSTQKVFGAYLEGENIHEVSFGKGGIILIGNESRGISPSLDRYITDKITIPRFGAAESLNAAIATAVICDNLRRR
ncbi:MAG: RNA methyltransferase [Chryseolinea sp.]